MWMSRSEWHCLLSSEDVYYLVNKQTSRPVLIWTHSPCFAVCLSLRGASLITWPFCFCAAVLSAIGRENVVPHINTLTDTMSEANCSSWILIMFTVVFYTHEMSPYRKGDFIYQLLVFKHYIVVCRHIVWQLWVCLLSLRRLRLPRGLRGIKLAPEKQLEPGDDV